jgi:hypothetical protein
MSGIGLFIERLLIVLKRVLLLPLLGGHDLVVGGRHDVLM